MPNAKPLPEKGFITFNVEGNDIENSPYFSREFHVPSASSGLTIGRGYDMAHRSPEEIRNDLVDAGVNADDADVISEAAGLTGLNAEAFVADKDLEDFTITWEQQLKLFEVVYEEIEKDTRRLATKPDVQRKYGETDWEKLDGTIQQILVDLRYRGDYTPSCRRFLQHHVARNDLARFTEEMENRNRWPNVPKDRFEQRAAFCRNAVDST